MVGDFKFEIEIRKPVLKVKRLNENAILPQRKRKGDAGLDLFSIEEVILNPGEFKLIGTGIALEIPESFVGIIKDRSGLASKNGITTMAGVIDENYRGEVKVLLHNVSDKPFKVEKGMRIAQLLIVPYLGGEVEEVEELSETERGEKGFGSSGLF